VLLFLSQRRSAKTRSTEVGDSQIEKESTEESCNGKCDSFEMGDSTEKVNPITG
jgi:hypothetical protein